ncbi:MAG TPA: PKD domain-containing protein [Chthoniobacterales bacterium]|jgi:hypothetical protein
MQKRLDILQGKRWLIIIAGVGLGLVLIGGPARVAQTAPEVTLIAIVQNQQCASSEFVNVALTATLSPQQRNVRYSWDFNNDGIFDTAPSRNPSVTHFYPDGTNQVATVKVTKETKSLTASVDFDALQCAN